MNELRDILIFLSVSFHRFFLNFLLYSGYFFMVVVLTAFAFFFSLRTFGNYTLFIAVMAVLIVIHFLVKQRLFRKRQLRLNLLFVEFLKNKGRQDITPVEPKEFSLKKVKKMKSGLKKEGAGFISNKLLLALTALQTGGGDDTWAKRKLRKLKTVTLKYIFIDVMVFLIILIPFALISFLFTKGLGVGIQLLIYLLGFLFVYFLNSAVFDPIVYLIIQAHAYRASRG
ncbi:hypothetical protein ACFLRB_05305 [Acidobacteriota bacterium]